MRRPSSRRRGPRGAGTVTAASLQFSKLALSAARRAALPIPVVWSDSCLLHKPGGEVWIGLPDPGNEVPARVETIRDALLGAGATLVQAAEHPDDAILAVHDEGLVAFLRDAWKLWQEAGYPRGSRSGPRRALSLSAPRLAGRGEAAVPAAMSARAGLYAFDTMTPIGAGTWEAARGAVDVALTAADLVLGGTDVAYACTRPPGTTSPAAPTAEAATSTTPRSPPSTCVTASSRPWRSSTSTPTRATERRRSSTDAPTSSRAPCTSILAPAGFRTSSASRPRAGRRTGISPSLRAQATRSGSRQSRDLADWARGADALVVALGVDAAEGDPTSPLRVTAAAFREGWPDPRLAGASDGDRAGGGIRSGHARGPRARGARGSRGGKAAVVPEPLEIWIGKEEYGGVPTPTRRESAPPPHWRLEAIAATERPRSLALAPGREDARLHPRPGHLGSLDARRSTNACRSG